ncbi:MAG: DUF885 domain-containing protein, partial [Candidatus Eiseniibacteriota bacterium]
LLVLAVMGLDPSGAQGAAPPATLARICDEYWQGTLEANPVMATTLGDRRFDARLADISPAGLEREQRRLEGVLARARSVPEAGLTPADRITRSTLILELENGLADLSCHSEEWVVDPLGGPQVSFMNLPDVTSIQTPKHAADYVLRSRAMGPYLDQHVAHLRRGLGAGRVAARDQVRKVMESLDALLATPVEAWALCTPLGAAHADWPQAARTTFRNDLAAAVRDVVKPAFERYRAFLRDQVSPAARPQEKAGLSFLPGGADCYPKRIRIETSLDLTPESLHQLGLEQVAAFRRDLSALGQRVLGTGDIAAIQQRLRADSAMHFRAAAEVEGKAAEALARARAAMPQWFGILPRTRCEVKVMGMHEAPNSTIAYYRQPAADGSRPGYYMINTYKPETRPRYEAEALAFHEAIPGHHLQIAIAQELTGVPEFRKHQGTTAFVEGWALYTERLADEMGLYSGDLDRIGMLSYDAWRACRLVVDTGLHAMGWSRQQAIDYMVANSVLAENNIVNEVDRYLSWPGQALAYKVGQLEILKLREEGRRRLGARFDIKGFHDAVLRNGAVALPVLREQVEAYFAQVEGAK